MYLHSLLRVGQREQSSGQIIFHSSNRIDLISSNGMGNGMGNGSHELIMCSFYENEEEQPLMIFISLEYYNQLIFFRSLIVMHVHAHLFKTEIIGYVAGYFFKLKSTSKHT